MSAKAERLHLRLDEAAADVLANRRVFMLDQQAWQVFDEALTRPAGDVAGLRELLAAPTVLDTAQTGEDE